MAERRRSFLRELADQKVHKWAWAAVALAYGALGLLRDDVLPYGVEHQWWGKSVQDHLTILDFLGRFTWWSWALVAACALLGMGFEAAYRLDQKRRETIRALSPDESLHLTYDVTDERCLKFRGSRYSSDATGEMYSFLVTNRGSKTLLNVTVRALPSWFTSTLVSETVFSRSVSRTQTVVIREIAAIDPGATDVIELFGLSYSPESSNPDHILNRVERFTLEARATDSKTVQLHMKYDPDARPMIQVDQT
jgi:hypothetical protein